jgi:glucose/arabinose dehydrogenase
VPAPAHGEEEQRVTERRHLGRTPPWCRDRAGAPLGKAGAASLLAGQLLAASCATDAVAVPAGFVDELVAGGLSAPTAMAFAPDGRLFVAEQAGAVRVVKDGALLAAPFVRLTVDPDGERGLLGIAFHPNFAGNGFVYLYHTVPGSPAHNRVTRFTASGDVARAGSAVPILDLDRLSSARNHNGGAIHFGPDGKLYVAVGDNADHANAQSLSNRLGKMLRINADGSIPADNPSSFPRISGSPVGANRAIWAVGLRNPFTFAIQRHSGAMIINDVGAQTFEEVNRGAAGRNYGWPASEGPTTTPGFTGPVYAYRHFEGTPTGCAITGGAFYDPPRAVFPERYVGKYFFADTCGGWIYHLDPAAPSTATLFHSGLARPVDLAVGADGALRYLERGDGQVRRIRYTGESVQAIVASATDLEVREGSQAVVAVRLAKRPTADRSVTVGRYLSSYASVTASPATLTFTPSNWSVGQRVTVSAAQDEGRADDGATFRLASTGLAAAFVRATAVDDDRPAAAPRAVISLPKNGDTVSGTNAEFFGDGLGEGAVVGAAFLVDGTVQYSDANSTGHYHLGGAHNRWDTTKLSNGDHLLTMRVTDAQGRWGAHRIRVKARN